ncbi:MAG: right-handed parallel beta-helix repeat-containing protein [Clostridiales bacterium]|nr:right-handed parallel beta-helix repeat-containing protein [Clostridiales bacterium]
MKKLISLSISVIALFTVFISGSFFANAAVSYTTISVSASDIESSSAYSAVQKALNTAKANATADNIYKVVVESGSYTLTSSLHIYSNTYLSLSGVTFTLPANTATNMLKVGATADTQSGYYYKNITISGGTWDANSNGSTVIKICHAQNVTLSGAVIKNCTDGHMMEVAGVNGLTVKNCTFKDQLLTTGSENTLTYEAIQLDILVSAHITGYLSEDLINKNITVTSCTFDNVPRGIGSHTGVLNNPMDTITITNNTFKNITSCAVQLMNCKNCTISSNTISGAPRGIAVYSYQLSGTYLSSTLAKEGSVASSTSTAYKTPSSSNIVISGNNITLSGTDPYATYENVGIFAGGLTLATSQAGSGDKMPAGDYYLSGVTIKNNTVNSTGHGIRLSDVTDSKISGNTLTYSGTVGDKDYGIQIRDNSQVTSVSSNTVKSYYRGIFVLASSVDSIKSNTVTSPSNNGISLEGADVTSIASNTVSSAGNNGINIYNSSTVGSIKSNTVSSAAKNGIFVQSSAVTGNIESNTIKSAKNNGIYIYDSASVAKIYKNTVTSAAKYGVGIENSTVTRISTNTIKKSTNNGINVIRSSKVGYINSNTIASAGKNAVFVQTSKVTSNIESNTITSPKNNGIYVYDSASVSKICKNSVSGAAKYGIDVDNATATKISDNTVSKSTNIGINVVNSAKVETISGNTVKNGSSKGISVSALKCAMKISKNTVSNCAGDVLISINPSSKKYTISITSNSVTGADTKKSTGIKVSSGNVKLTSNTVKSCKVGILLSTSASGTVYNNTLKSNKSNKLTIGSKKYSFLKTASLSVSKKAKTSLKIKWGAVSGASGYIIYRSTSQDGTYKKIATVSSSSKTYTDKNLKKGKKYYYKIVAYRTVGNYTIYSSESAVLSAKTKS